MDPASASELRDFLSRSNSRMDHQDEQGAVSNRAIQALVSQVSKLTTQLQSLQTEPEQRTTAANSPAPTIPDQADRSSSPASHLQPFILVSPSYAAPSLSNVHSISPSNHRRFLPRIEDSIRYHTTLWTGSSLGNYRLGAETSLLHFVSVIFGGDQKGV